MITLSNEQLQEILLDLPAYYPKSQQLDSIIRNRLSGKYTWPGTEILADNYPEYAVLLCRPIARSTEYIPAPKPYTVVLFCKNPDKLDAVLRVDDFVDWSQRVCFFAVSKDDVWPALLKRCEEKGNIEPVSEGYAHSYVQLLHPSYLIKSELPEGFRLGDLSEEHAELVNRQWPNNLGTPATLQYYQYALRHKFPSSGIFTTDGRLVAYILYCFDGSLVNGYVDPEYRNKGLYQVVNYDVARKVIAMGHPYAWCYVFRSNTASLNAYQKLGAKKLDLETYSIDWHVFQPTAE